jgi:hypothetical protein
MEYEFCFEMYKLNRRIQTFQLTFQLLPTESQDSISVSIVIRLWAGQLWPDTSNWQRFFFVKTSFGSHPAFSWLGTKVLSVGIKWPGYETDLSPSPDVTIKTMWICTSIPLTSRCGCLINYRNIFHIFQHIECHKGQFC